MGFWDWFIGILLLIVALGVLVTIHELGHLIAAKTFNVYCLEFSIGFGPAIFSRKPTGKKETKFSIRAFPLGGYVSMFGEEMEEADIGIAIPKERSLEAQKKWKRAIIYVAGVVMNFILGFSLLMVYNCCFPLVSVDYYRLNTNEQIEEIQELNNSNAFSLAFSLNVENGSAAETAGITNENLFFAGIYNYPETKGLSTDKIQAQYSIVADNIEIQTGDIVTKYVLCISPSPKALRDSSVMVLFQQSEETFGAYVDGNLVKNVHKPLISEKDGKTVFPENRKPLAGESITADLVVLFKGSDESIISAHKSLTYNCEKDGTYKTNGLKFEKVEQWLPFGQRMANTFSDFGYSTVAIGKGIIGLFTGSSWSSIGGPIKIAEQITSIYANYGFSKYVYYAGFLSVNLALFNLIPFPGLDGWSLLVVIFEGITRRKMPQKVKAIFQVVGLVLLFGLMIVIAIKDIIGLF